MTSNDVEELYRLQAEVRLLRSQFVALHNALHDATIMILDVMVATLDVPQDEKDKRFDAVMARSKEVLAHLRDAAGMDHGG